MLIINFPVIDIEPLTNSDGDKIAVAEQMAQACKDSGFFYIKGHGVDTAIQDDLERLSWEFFDLQETKKSEIAMDKGGNAWRGYFSMERELTSGKPDLKEGLYFGEQMSLDHPMVIAGTPLHGPNLFPEITGFKTAVLDYLSALNKLGAILMEGLALSLKLSSEFFESLYMTHPLFLFRIFHYPAPTQEHLALRQWGVGEHTDYGVLTILKQDPAGGLQVLTKEKWTDAPYIENTFICNIGDMLDLMTGGYYRSTPHRVLNKSGRGRLSFPFFFDLDFDARVEPIDLTHLGHTRAMTFHRWDESDLQAFSGTYGEYLLKKISKVFPQLRDDVL